jgi:catechol 2,3-dioxygenase-like lactoylglutathione lyase family enzyme
MTFDLHHAHIFARDIDATIAWWSRHLDGRVLRDEVLAGARNVFLGVGSGRIHIYDQPPRDGGRGAIHHLVIKVTGLRDAWARLQAAGVTSRQGLREFEGWRYVMVAAPDDVLLELFEFDDPARLG